MVFLESTFFSGGFHVFGRQVTLPVGADPPVHGVGFDGEVGAPEGVRPLPLDLAHEIERYGALTPSGR